MSAAGVGELGGRFEGFGNRTAGSRTARRVRSDGEGNGGGSVALGIAVRGRRPRRWGAAKRGHTPCERVQGAVEKPSMAGGVPSGACRG